MAYRRASFTALSFPDDPSISAEAFHPIAAIWRRAVPAARVSESCGRCVEAVQGIWHVERVVE
jgi:hypothetical protein